MYKTIKSIVLSMIYMLTQTILDKSLITSTRILERVKMIIYRIKWLATKS